MSRRLQLNENYFNKIDTQNKAYLLGMLLSDGSIGGPVGKSYYVRIELQDRDYEIIKFFLKELYIGEQPSIYSKKVNNKKYNLLCISSVKICNELSKYGCIKNKTFNIEYPELLKKYNRHFIRGYFDGDGTITKTKIKNKYRYYFSICGTEKFLNKLQNIFNLELKIKPKSLIKDGNIHKITYTKFNDVCKIYNYLYDDAFFYLRRKKTKFKQAFNYLKKNKFSQRTENDKYVYYDKKSNRWMTIFDNKKKSFENKKNAIKHRNDLLNEVKKNESESFSFS